MNFTLSEEQEILKKATHNFQTDRHHKISVAKAWISEAYERVIALAHQIHGAISVTIDHDLQYYTKRAKAAELTFGDADFYREIVAQEMGL